MKKLLIIMAMVAVSSSAFAQSFTKDQTKEIEGIIANYIKTNPKIIIEALEILQDQMVEEQKQAAKKALSDNRAELESGDLFIGNKDGKVVIVDFFDYNCGYCRSMFKTLESAVAKDKDVKVVIKELPSLSQASTDVSKIAIAASFQGKYKELHTKIMSSEDPATKEIALKIAEELKLDMAKLKTDMESSKVQDIIDANRELAIKLGSQSVPTIIIGDYMSMGAIKKEELDKLIKQEKDKKQQLTK